MSFAAPPRRSTPDTICEPRSALMAMHPRLPERFWAKVDRNGPVPAHRPELGPCWVWEAGHERHGYGRVGWGAAAMLAHRWAYREAHGSIPELPLDHLCVNPPCVRPSHLEAVPQRENMRRGTIVSAREASQRSKTRCGHRSEERRL